MIQRRPEQAPCTEPQTGKLIHHFEMGQLSEADRVRFEMHLLRCEFCATEVEAMFPVAAAMRANRESIWQGLAEDGITLKNRQSLLPKESRDPRTQSASGWTSKLWRDSRKALADVSMKWKLLGAGGAFALSAAVVLLLVFSSPKIAGQYVPLLSFQALPYEGSIRLRGDSSNPGQSDFDGGMRDYLFGNYAHAIPQFKHAVRQSPNQGEWWLYLGVACYLEKDIKRALASLQKADALLAGDNQNTVRWYLAQSYLLAGMRSEAESLLDGLAARNNEYTSRAIDLRNRLRTVRP
jgi:tetratricopeptide (TPR) repeat protein